MSSFAEIGKKFKDQRKSKNISIDLVTSITRINTSYIEAIESGDFSVFPAEAFARAYFKKYANFLDLEIDFPIKPQEISGPRSKEVESKNYLFLKTNIRNLNIYLGLIAGVIFLAIIIFSYNPINKAKPELDPNESNILKEVVLADMNSSSSYQKDQAIDDLKNTMEFMPDSNFEFSKAPEEPKYFNETKSRLKIDFLGQSWVEIYQFDKRLVYELFQEGSSFEIKIEKPFRIVIGNSKNTELYYQGDKIDLDSIANIKNVSVLNFND
jgi:transcriptional regulator with XRE-family HTH domain